MTPKEKSEHAQRLLARYVREIKKYKAVWQIPPDRYVHLNAWAAARKEFPNNLGEKHERL